MDALLSDLRFALRAIRRRPAFAITAVLSLTIAIAATTSVFSLVNAALLKNVPGVRRPQRLVEIARDVGGEPTDVTYQVFRLVREQRGTLDDVAAFALTSASIAADAEPSARGALAVSARYFDLLGVQPARGRLFAPGEADYPAVAPVALVSHDVWQRELSGRADVVGRSVLVNGVPVEIIGVLPPGFDGHHTGLLTDIYVPLGVRIPGFPNPSGFESFNGSSLELLGRLRADVTAEQAARELSLVAARYAQSAGEASAAQPYRLQIAPWGPLPNAVRPPVAIFLFVLLTLVALALVMAGVNVSTVLLARAAERQREIALRRAIGARQSRIVRQLLTETAVLFVAAGLAAIIVSSWATSVLHGLTPSIPVPGRLGADFGVDARVLAFAALLTLAACLAFSLLPAVQSSRVALSATLKHSGAASDSRGRVRLRSVMLAVQVALTSVLLSASLLFGRALGTMRALQPGWNADGVYVAAINLELNGTPAERGAVFYREVLQQLSRQPGIEAAAFAAKLPIGGRSSLGLIQAPGIQPPQNGLPGFDAAFNRVTPGYFATMQIPILRGRDFTPTDEAGSPFVAIVGASMARRIWGNADPVGATFNVGSGQYRRNFTVIGVSADAQLTAPGRTPDNLYYIPLAQMYNSDATLHVRARAGFERSVATTVRAALRQIAPSLPLPAIRSLNEALGVYLLPQRLATVVAAAMSVFGLLLAGIGIYGVTAFIVSRRARELAIRIALGATPRQVTRLVIWQGGRAPLAGMLLGLGAAFASSIVIGKVVIGVRPGDPLVFALVPSGLALMALVAMATPLRRLVRSAPMARLRED